MTNENFGKLLTLSETLECGASKIINGLKIIFGERKSSYGDVHLETKEIEEFKTKQKNI